MGDEPQVKVHSKGLDDEFPKGPPTAVIRYLGCQLILRFADGDPAG
jgi:hypothetical protein